MLEKLLSSAKMKEKFLTEAKISTLAQHPNVIQTFGAYDDAVPIIMMGTFFLPGG